jgi:hypothetical protein
VTNTLSTGGLQLDKIRGASLDLIKEKAVGLDENKGIQRSLDVGAVELIRGFVTWNGGIFEGSITAVEFVASIIFSDAVITDIKGTVGIDRRELESFAVASREFIVETVGAVVASGVLGLVPVVCRI